MIPRAVLLRTLRQSPCSRRTLPAFVQRHQQQQQQPHKTRARHASHVPYQQSKSTADEKIEDITELYATAQDEFEIAMEETEKQSVYAEEDRNAAREELTKVQEAYKAVLEGNDKALAEEVQKRIGQRIRELEQGVKAMEELAQNQD